METPNTAHSQRHNSQLVLVAKQPNGWQRKEEEVKEDEKKKTVILPAKTVSRSTRKA